MEGICRDVNQGQRMGWFGGLPALGWFRIWVSTGVWVYTSVRIMHIMLNEVLRRGSHLCHQPPKTKLASIDHTTLESSRYAPSHACALLDDRHNCVIQRTSQFTIKLHGYCLRQHPLASTISFVNLALHSLGPSVGSPWAKPGSQQAAQCRRSYHAAS